MMTEEQIRKFYSIRKEAGRNIDPVTAEVDWEYGLTLDPYGITDPAVEELQIGRNYFARSPGSSIWVELGDLPSVTRDALWEKHKSKLAFTALPDTL